MRALLLLAALTGPAWGQNTLGVRDLEAFGRLVDTATDVLRVAVCVPNLPPQTMSRLRGRINEAADAFAARDPAPNRREFVQGVLNTVQHRNMQEFTMDQRAYCEGAEIAARQLAR